MPCSSLRDCRLLVLISFLAQFLLTAAASGQITDVTNVTSTPIPGRGHDYIKLLSETVSPANGAVSLRIQVPTPPGRRLSLPFAFAYDSNGSHHMESNGKGATQWWDNTAALAAGGWSYSLPMLFNVSVDIPGGTGPDCLYYNNYVFEDESGGRHSLYVSLVPDPTSCTGKSSKLTGGDDYYQAVLTNQNSPLRIADADGAVYTFPCCNLPYVGGGGTANSQSQSGLPSSIEDRNGNIVSIADHGNGAFTVTDTLGRTLLSSSAFGSSGNTLTASGLGGSYTLTWGTANSNYSAGGTRVYNSGSCAGSINSDVQTVKVITKLTLPNNTFYSFSYDPTYGVLSKITYPNGGYVSYTYSVNPLSEQAQFEDLNGKGTCIWHHGTVAVAHRYVSFDGANIAQQQDFSYSTTWGTGYPYQWGTKSTTVTTTDKITGQSYTTSYTYNPITLARQPNDGTQFGGQVPVEGTVVYKDTTGTMLRTVTKSWHDQYELTNQQTALENSQTSKTAYTYGAGAQVTEKDDYDYGSGAPGSLLQKITTTYQSFSSTPIFPSETSVFDRPCRTITYDGSSNRVAETDYTYDGGTTVCGTAGTPSVQDVSGLPTGTHDETHYSASSTASRGNVTQKTQWLNTGTSPLTKYTYDKTGQVLSVKDPCGNATCSDMTGSAHTTNYSYADSYSVLSGGTNVPYTPSANTNAFITQITDPLTHTANFTYDFHNGELTVSKDANSQGDSYLYNDAFARPTQMNYPDGGQTSFTYNDSTYNQVNNTPNVQSTKAITSGLNLTSTTAMDGLGHVVQTELTSDPDGPTYTAKSYDGEGKPYQVYNPTRCSPPTTNCGESTWGYTTYTYDSLGRTTKVAYPDGTSIATSYTGRATDVLDEGNGTRNTERVSQVDALGRLVSVCEVTSTTQLGAGGTPAACSQDIARTGFLTTYAYDAFGNLLSANQGSLGQRTFAYDSLPRLLCAANPETGSATCPNPDNGIYTAGTTRYGYDANGNLISRTRPAPNQANGAVTVAATYQYDVLNRLTQKSYSDGVTPNAMFGYDQASVTMGTQQFNITNSIGRLSFECTLTPTTCTSAAANMNAFSYDPMGRTAQLWQCQHLNCPLPNIVFAYDYDLIGDELDYFVGTSPHGSTEYVSTYSSAGRLTSFTTPTWVDSTNPANLLTSVQYDAFGHIVSGNLANGLSLSSGYDARGRVTAMAVGTINCSGGNCSTNKYRFTTAYYPNSDIASSTDTVNGNWTYAYDDLNRLSTAVANNGEGCSWDYDRYGNRWHQNEHSGNCTAPQYSFSGGNNRIDGYSYDAAGNLLNDGFHSYQYDAENRIVSVDGGATTYIYDAEGRRYSKTTGGVPEETIYDRMGNPRYRGNFGPSDIFAAGMHLGTYIVNSGHTDTIFYYDHSDWLGTERARTDLSGTPCETIASLPFGDNQTITSTCADLSPLHFTGKERDTESGLDNFGARYNASTMGRFMTPDPLYLELHRLIDPQQLNLYSYVRNNPLSLTDPTGLDITCTGDRCKDYLAALAKDVSFKVKYDDNGKVVATVDKDAKLSRSDKAFLKAIDDTKNHVTINAIGGGKDSSVFFGASHGSTHTINFDQAALLDSAKNAGGMTSAGLVGHETLEGYDESKGYSMSEGHDYATGLGFPGLDPGRITGLFGNAQTGTAYGFTQQFQVHGTGTTENIRINFVTPIPAASVHSGMNAAGYPVSVEKAQ